MTFKWWGYLHTEGSVQVKRYFDYEDIAEAEESSFCERVHGPFDAKDRGDAIKQMKKWLDTTVSEEEE